MTDKRIPRRERFDSLGESYYGPCPPTLVTNERQTEINTQHPLDLRVEELTQELAQAINAGAEERREQLREMAVHQLRDQVTVVESGALAAEPGQGFNPFGIAIPLVLVGGVLLILFPPVGLFLFATAGMMMLWGVAAILFSRR